MNVFIANFPGLGNGVMLHPPIQFAIANGLFEQVFCIENALITSKDYIRQFNLQGRLTSVPGHWRRFDSDHRAIESFIIDYRISHVFNLRNENLDDYQHFKKAFSSISFHDFDLSVLNSRSHPRPIYEDIFDMFDSLGYANNKEDCEWLRRDSKPNASRRIGFAVSSSQRSKQCSLSFWTELAHAVLQSSSDVEISIISGVSDEERRYAVELEALVNDVRCADSGPLGLKEVSEAISSLACLVALDTGLIHVAGALGVATVGLYKVTDPRVWRPNTFSPFTAISHSSLGSCPTWRHYSGTCTHFYSTCESSDAQVMDVQSVTSAIHASLSHRTLPQLTIF